MTIGDTVYAVKEVTCAYRMGKEHVVRVRLTLFERRVLTREPLYELETPPQWEVRQIYVENGGGFASSAAHFEEREWKKIKPPEELPYPVFPGTKVEGNVVLFTTPSSGNSFSLGVNPGETRLRAESATTVQSFDFTDFAGYVWAQKKAWARRDVLVAQGRLRQLLREEKSQKEK